MKDEEKEINTAFHEHTQKELKKSKYNTLVERYPDVFKQMESSLPMPYYLFGFECGEGWYDIIERLAAKINFELEEDPALNDLFYVTQVKEKFGGLRFYVTGATEPIWDAIGEAERESSVTCELCGEEGTHRTSDWGWHSTRCDKCWEKENE